MADDLNKNITIQVTADTSDLEQSITNLNQAITSLFAQQKQLNTAGQQIYRSKYFANIFCKSSFCYLFLQHKLFTMKKILLITLLLIPFFGFSQTTKPVDGFLGIKFGTTRTLVLSTLKARGARLDPRSNANTLAFTHISLGHRAAEYLIVRFVNNKAFDAEFTFKPDDNNQVIDYYKSLENDLNDIYGSGTDDIKYTAPYTQGDGHDVGALLVGAAQYNTTWQDANNNSINLSIEKEEIANLTISLTYLNDALSKLEDERLKAKDKGDM